MANLALIFAGGTGQRMRASSRPKQFLELDGKPIIIHTVEVFSTHPAIDAICIVCLGGWIEFLEGELERFGVGKVCDVVGGGATSQESICAGVMRLASEYAPGDCVLVHDGVRPLVDAPTIDACIASVEEHGSAITVVPATETIVRAEDGVVDEIIDRTSCVMARAPQCFRLGELERAHRRALDEARGDFIDCASLMSWCGHELRTVMGSPDNIKITTPSDYYVFRAIKSARDDSEVFGC